MTKPQRNKKPSRKRLRTAAPPSEEPPCKRLRTEAPPIVAHLRHHDCSIFQCALEATADSNVYVCPRSGNLHRCGLDCDNCVEHEGHKVCRYTGFVLEGTATMRQTGLVEWMLRHNDFRDEQQLASDLQDFVTGTALQPAQWDAMAQTSRMARRVSLEKTPGNTVTRTIHELINVTVVRFLSEQHAEEISADSQKMIMREKQRVLVTVWNQHTRRRPLPTTLALAALLHEQVDEKQARLTPVCFSDPRHRRDFANGTSMEILHLLWTVIAAHPSANGAYFFKRNARKTKTTVHEVHVVVFALLCVFVWFPQGVALFVQATGREVLLVPKHSAFVAYLGQRAVCLPKIRAGFEVLRATDDCTLNRAILTMDKKLREALLAAVNASDAKHNDFRMKFSAIGACDVNPLSLSFTGFGQDIV